jgi:hypothetical protein
MLCARLRGHNPKLLGQPQIAASRINAPYRPAATSDCGSRIHLDTAAMASTTIQEYIDKHGLQKKASVGGACWARVPPQTGAYHDPCTLVLAGGGCAQLVRAGEARGSPGLHGGRGPLRGCQGSGMTHLEGPEAAQSANGGRQCPSGRRGRVHAANVVGEALSPAQAACSPPRWRSRPSGMRPRHRDRCPRLGSC